MTSYYFSVDPLYLDIACDLPITTSQLFNPSQFIIQQNIKLSAILPEGPAKDDYSGRVGKQIKPKCMNQQMHGHVKLIQMANDKKHVSIYNILIMTKK